MVKKYKIGDIPSQVAYSNQVLSLKIESSLGKATKYSLSASPKPEGELALDEVTGTFSYSPKNNTIKQFSITFEAKNGAKMESQTVRITPLPDLPSEYDIITNGVIAPESTSKTYMHATERVIGHKLFNQTDQESEQLDTKEITISGVFIILEQNNAEHEFYKSINKRTDIEILNIYADEMIVRSPLNLPSTTITIHTRSLIFEGDGCINTTPVEITSASLQKVGLNGSRGGDIHMNVQEIIAPSSKKRLITRGGDGQAAMEGEAGTKGNSFLTTWNGKYHRDMIWFDPEIDLDWNSRISELGGYTPTFVAIIHTQMSSGSTYSRGYVIPKEKYEILTTTAALGAPIWPTDGTPPKINPGRPGEGGVGGDIYLSSEHNLSPDLIDTSGGMAGEKAKDITGAEAGKPKKACHVKAYWKSSSGVQKTIDRLEITERHTVTNGAPGPAPAAKKPKGNNGKIQKISKVKSGYWLHPLVARNYIEYTNDVFLAGRQDIVRPTLQLYLDTLNALCKTEKDQLDFSSLSSEVSGLTRRMDSVYDYFGNPAGWVPMLSFQSNLKLYKNEIETSARLLFLSYWIEQNQHKADQLTKGLEVTIAQLDKETQSAIADHKAAIAELRELDLQFRNLQVDISDLLDALGILEEKLRKKVKDDLQLEHIIRSSAKLLGGVLQMIPVGQPALGAFGTGLSVLADFDPEEPFDTVKSLGSEVWGTNLVQKKLLPKATESAKSFLKIKTEGKTELTNFDKEKAKKELAGKVKKALDEEKAVKEQVTTALRNFTVPDDEIEEALQRAIADSPEYTEISEEIASLGERKTEFANKIHSTMLVLDIASETIINNEQGKIAIREQLSAAIEGLNHEARRYASALGQRARNRLIKYQYYLVKSYNYLMLEPLSKVDYKASYMLKEFTRLLGDSEDGTLTEQQYEVIKSIFEDELKKITTKIINRYTNSAPAPGLPLGVSLDPQQIQTLNQTGQLTINLMEMGALFLTDDEIRITNIETSLVNLVNPPDKKTVNVKLEYRHPGISVLRKNGRQYLFRTGDYSIPSGNKGNPKSSYRQNNMLWGANVQHKLNGEQKIDEIKPSPSTESLIHHLISGSKDEDASKSLEYYRPSAWADISIRRTASPVSYSGHIDNLSLEIEYEYVPVTDNIRSVYICTAGEMMPFIKCNTEDLNYRSNGVGSFLRTYDDRHTSKIKLTAPAYFGESKFIGWKIVTGGHEGDQDKPLELTPLMTDTSARTFSGISQLSGEEYNRWMTDMVKSRNLTLELTRNYFVIPVYLHLLNN